MSNSKIKEQNHSLLNFTFRKLTKKEINSLRPKWVSDLHEKYKDKSHEELMEAFKEYIENNVKRVL